MFERKVTLVIIEMVIFFWDLKTYMLQAARYWTASAEE